MLRALLILMIVVEHLFVIRGNTFEIGKSVCQQRSSHPPQVGQRCITETEVYINKTNVQHQHHCTLLCMKNSVCQVANFNITGRYCLLGRAPCVSLEREIDLVTTFMSRQPCLKWVPDYMYNDDAYTTICFKVSDRQTNTLCVVRVRKGENKIPGKHALDGNSMYYSWEGREMALPKSNAEYLTISADCNINWVAHDSTSGKPLPVGAVIGGLLNNAPLYVARKSAVHTTGHPVRFCSGYYDNVKGLGHFPYDVRDVTYTQVEVLVVED